MYENNNYSNNNPYQSPNNDNMNRQLQEQRRLDDERQKRQYKMLAEQSLDMIVTDYRNAKKNEVEVGINEADKSAVVRYYKRYWDNEFMVSVMVILILTAILSFYTTLAVVGILVVLLLKYLYSQLSFLKYYLNDHRVNEEEMKEIENILFGYKLDLKKVFIIALVLSIISFIISRYSFNLFIDLQAHKQLFHFLANFGHFDPKNELFAYTNMGAIFTLLLLKTYEKWSK